MINSKDSSRSSSPSSANGGGGGGLKMKYKGVRKRAWGKWVSEIRLPNSRERIWLGSYDSPDKAARAFDAATFCLRGRKARFNFPDQIPDIPGGLNLTPPEIQEAASKFANETTVTRNDGSTTSLQESSGGDEMNEGLLDDDIGRWNPSLTATESIDLFLEEKPVVNGEEWPEFDGSCFDSFDEFNEEYFPPRPPPPPSDDSSFDIGEENISGGGDEQYYTSQHSFLWDF